MAVYMIRVGADGPVKIGVAAHPQKRLSALQTGHPEALTMLRVMEGDRHFESALHRHFAHLRTRGEWFTHCNQMLGDLDFLRRSAANDSRPAQPTAIVQVELLAEIESFLATRMSLSETKFGLLAVNDGKLVPRIRAGRNMTVATIDRTRQFINDNAPPSPEPVRVAK
jgi:hypothetical protein